MLPGSTPLEYEHRLRIAFLGLGRYSGGSPIPLHLAKALARRHTLRAFLGREGRNLKDWAESLLDYEVHDVYRSVMGALGTFLWPRRIQRLATAIIAFEPDVMVVPFTHAWVLPLMMRVRIPVVLFVHDPEPHPGLVGRVAHMVERRIVSRCSHVVIHTAKFLPVLTSIYGVEKDRISVVPLGPLLDYTEGVSIRRKFPLATPAAARILTFGRVEQYKGIDVLLDAVPLIRAALPNATVHLVGSGGDEKLLARASGTAGVQVDNRWVDDSEVPGLFSDSDIVVLPYTSATQSGVIPIAAAFGLPVVATSAGGLAEQLCDGRCGVLVRPGDPTALASAILKLASDPVAARAMGQALSDEYTNNRSWPAIAETVTSACLAALKHPA